MTTAAESHSRLRRTTTGSSSRGAPAAHGSRIAEARAASDEWLTVDEVCLELKIGRRTFERWRMLGKAPRAVPLAGSGPLRIRRRWLDEWMETGA